MLNIVVCNSVEVIARALLLLKQDPEMYIISYKF